MYTAKITDRQKASGQIIVSVEFTDGTNPFNETYRVIDKNQLDRNIERRIELLNLIDTEVEKISVGDWVTPLEVVQIVKEPTAEEIKQMEISQKEMELNELTEKVKKEKEVTTLALENADIKAKLDELELLKTK